MPSHPSPASLTGVVRATISRVQSGPKVSTSMMNHLSFPESENNSALLAHIRKNTFCTGSGLFSAKRDLLACSLLLAARTRQALYIQAGGPTDLDVHEYMRSSRCDAKPSLRSPCRIKPYRFQRGEPSVFNELDSCPCLLHQAKSMFTLFGYASSGSPLLTST